MAVPTHKQLGEIGMFQVVHRMFIILSDMQKNTNRNRLSARTLRLLCCSIWSRPSFIRSFKKLSSFNDLVSISLHEELMEFWNGPILHNNLIILFWTASNAGISFKGSEVENIIPGVSSELLYDCNNTFQFLIFSLWLTVNVKFCTINCFTCMLMFHAIILL